MEKADETDPNADRIRCPEPSDLGAIVRLIRERDLMVHVGSDLSEAELRADWGSMDPARDARLALGPRGEAIVGYAAASAGGPGRVDVEFYARPDAANGDAGSRLLRWAERRAGELAAEAFSDRSRRPSGVRTGVLQCAVGAADATARGLLESAGYTLARVFFCMEVDLGGRSRFRRYPKVWNSAPFPAGGPDRASPWPSRRPSRTTGGTRRGRSKHGREGGRRKAPPQVPDCWRPRTARSPARSSARPSMTGASSSGLR